MMVLLRYHLARVMVKTMVNTMILDCDADRIFFRTGSFGKSYSFIPWSWVFVKALLTWSSWDVCCLGLCSRALYVPRRPLDVSDCRCVETRVSVIWVTMMLSRSVVMQIVPSTFSFFRKAASFSHTLKMASLRKARSSCTSKSWPIPSLVNFGSTWPAGKPMMEQ